MSMDQTPTSPKARQRGFSFRSDKSGGSGTKNKLDLTESPQDKARRDSIWKNSSKANPNAALNEAQPGVLNVTEESTLESLRDSRHKDVNGNVIVDPDLSNPTRPRMERPLDTIRSFERAIDNGYKRRSSYARTDSGDQNNQYASRRSSYFGGEYPLPNKNRRRPVTNGQSAGYESGPSPHRQSSYNGGGGYYGNQRPDSYAGGHNGPPRQRYGNRMQSDSAIPGYGRPYPQHNYHQSQDTMNTGVTNGSDSTGPWANSTDPSSENSSIDKNLNIPKGDGYAYGANGYGNQTIQEEGSGSYGGYSRQGGYPAHGGPVQAPNGPRRPIPLGDVSGAPSMSRTLPSTARPEPEKKKGWLKRRFSKKD